MTDTPSDSAAQMIKASPSTELASDRTGLAFERTHLAADRTLMAIVRTALSLISFGFTMYKLFQQLNKSNVLENANLTARRVGIGLIVLGTGLLAAGLWSHSSFSRNLSGERDRLMSLGLMNEVGRYRATPTFIVAALLLCMGIFLLLSIAFRILD